jgi:hypothetical protein
MTQTFTKKSCIYPESWNYKTHDGGDGSSEHFPAEIDGKNIQIIQKLFITFEDFFFLFWWQTFEIENWSAFVL